MINYNELNKALSADTEQLTDLGKIIDDLEEIKKVIPQYTTAIDYEGTINKLDSIIQRLIEIEKSYS